MFFTKKPKIQKIKEEINKNSEYKFSLTDIFPDFNLANIIAQQLRINPKQKITLNQLNSVETLNCQGMNIESLEGIEFLNNLKTANFSNNKITKLPDYTDSNLNLYKNRNSLVLMDLSNNPFLDPNNLFSLDSSEKRRKFLGQFEDSYSRFKLGEIKERIYPNNQINPALIRITIDNLLPRQTGKDRDKDINNIFLKYLLGKKIFYDQTPYKDSFILNNGKLNFKKDLITPNYLSEENKKIVSQLIEEIIPKEDLYLLRSIINNNQDLIKLDFNNFNDLLVYYEAHPEEISDEYIKDKNSWKEKSCYSDLMNSSLSSQEELLLKSIQNTGIKNEYNKYLQIKDVLELYQKEHPEKNEEIYKIINKSDDQITNFLNQYISLERNTFLTEKQKETIKQVQKSLETFNSNYLKQATDLFEQDVFGLEVEMKYIDMLAEANKKII